MDIHIDIDRINELYELAISTYTNHLSFNRIDECYWKEEAIVYYLDDHRYIEKEIFKECLIYDRWKHEIAMSYRMAQLDIAPQIIKIEDREDSISIFMERYTSMASGNMIPDEVNILLDKMHQDNVIHLDIHRMNIMYMITDDIVKYVIIDYGRSIPILNPSKDIFAIDQYTDGNQLIGEKFINGVPIDYHSR